MKKIVSVLALCFLSTSSFAAYICCPCCCGVASANFAMVQAEVMLSISQVAARQEELKQTLDEQYKTAQQLLSLEIEYNSLKNKNSVMKEKK